MPAWDLLRQRMPVTRTGRWRSSLGRGAGRRAGPADIVEPMQIPTDGACKPGITQKGAQESLCTAAVPGWPYTLHKIPGMASSKPASTLTPALELQSILASWWSTGERQNRGKRQNKTCTNLMARKASLYARSASWGSRAENRYLAKVCMGTLSRWMTSPKPLKGPPRQKQSLSAIISTAGSVARVCTTPKL